MVNNKRISERQRRRDAYQEREWYTIRSLMGNDWAFFYILLGARERGKSYSVEDYCVRQWKYHHIPFTWMRLIEPSTKKLLANDGMQFIDPDLQRKYGLLLKTKGNCVFDASYDLEANNGEIKCTNKNKMANVLALSTAHNDKGIALFDNEYKGNINIVLDEMCLEKSQRKTFDITYNLVLQLENLCRSRKEHIHIFMIGNNTQEASDILAMFNFIPDTFGVYKLRSKNCVIDYMPNSKAYDERRKGTVGNILAGESSNYTNITSYDLGTISKCRLMKPTSIVKFTKDKKDWFTIWDSNVLEKYNNERLNTVYAMRRYVDEIYHSEIRDAIIEREDSRGFFYHSLLVQKQFRYQLSLLKRQ